MPRSWKAITLDYQMKVLVLWKKTIEIEVVRNFFVVLLNVISNFRLRYLLFLWVFYRKQNYEKKTSPWVGGCSLSPLKLEELGHWNLYTSFPDTWGITWQGLILDWNLTPYILRNQSLAIFFGNEDTKTLFGVLSLRKTRCHLMGGNDSSGKLGRWPM